MRSKTSFTTHKEQGAIVFLDILGTKNKWEETDAEDFLKDIESLYTELDQIYETIKKMGNEEILEKIKIVNDIQKVGNPTSNKSKNDIKDELSGIFKKIFKMNVATFSDTIIIAFYSQIKDDKIRMDALLLHFLGYMLTKIFRLAFLKKIYLRGTISIGIFYLLEKESRLLFLGPAVNEAAELYESTNWIGISTSPSASLALEQDLTFFDFFEQFKKIIELDKGIISTKISNDDNKIIFEFLKLFIRYLDELKKVYIKYDIPNKKGIEKKGHALAWPLVNDNYSNDIENRLKEQLHFIGYQNKSIGYDVYMKIKNTKDFYDSCKETKLEIKLDELSKEINS